MVEYVAGFLFSEEGSIVALVEKQKPEWQKGKLNAIGGKIEDGETPLTAMIREFDEEAGLLIADWEEVAVLQGADFTVHFFACFSELVIGVRTMEVEQIGVWSTTEALKQARLMPNLRVLIPLALDASGITKPVMMFDGIAESSQDRGNTRPLHHYLGDHP